MNIGPIHAIGNTQGNLVAAGGGAVYHSANELLCSIEATLPNLAARKARKFVGVHGKPIRRRKLRFCNVSLWNHLPLALDHAARKLLARYLDFEAFERLKTFRHDDLQHPTDGN